MGCDIHLCVEVRPLRLWRPAILTEAGYDIRNYTLFAWLANVRNYDDPLIVPISEPRGLPGDVSDVVRAELACDDLHSRSWLLATEILEHPSPPAGVQGFTDWLRGIVINDHTMMGTLRRGARIVFAFDN